MRTPYWNDFEMACASVAGAFHRRRGRGNQDGLRFAASGASVVAVVTDGCGSSGGSEVGAQLGAGLWCKALLAEKEANPSAPMAVEAILRARVSVLETLSQLLDALPGSRAELVRDWFLFTTVGAIIDDDRAIVFAIGDGVVAINGAVTKLSSGPTDAPAYLSYELCPETRGLGEFTFLTVQPTHEINSLVLATDGATELIGEDGDEWLAEFATEDALYANPDALRRRLTLLAAPRTSIDWERQRTRRHASRLVDDTTLIAMRRKRPAVEVGR